MATDDAEEIAAGTCPTASGMPMLGLGTWQNTDPDQCAESIETALEMGYRHIDTAQAYDNEEAVGEGIAAADVPREDVFLATKVSTSNLASEDVLETAHESADRLGVETIDLLYVHWPKGSYDAEDTLSAFDELYDKGLIENVGVSNFEPRHIEEAMDILDAPVFANQVELHPLLPQEHIREACENYDVEVVAYSPIARGEVFDVEELREIAANHDTSEAAVALAWAREKGVTTIPKATGRDHIADNWESLSIDLDSDEVNMIDSIDRINREVDPDDAPWN
ncbi:aldo/keto reductase [Saliphagus infecundisoli]|uniref:Aldo/keto reductase n=1 Tax=Saliphagus infecundisoli TaxID=1849069 RepID=A0ABD5QDA2_9EURY|nr:aldo/keto reductase [Saliphagus infecundisoli]